MPQFSTPSSRWAAIQSRNPLAESAFIYSVTTTKIYCRPTCPSRLARRANITFHDSAAEAEADGFRPCKRCRPESAGGCPHKVFVNKACKLIGKEIQGGEKWGVKALAKEVGLTESHFCRVFKKVMGMTIGEYRSQLHPRVTESSSKEVMVAPVAAQGADSVIALDVLSERIDNGNWELSLTQYPLDLDQNWASTMGCMPTEQALFDNQLLGLDCIDLEMSGMTCLNGSSDQHILDTWDDENLFINYDF
jgi:methylphosphotriester-DNA--protein-cysteine methyltransferase